MGGRWISQPDSNGAQRGGVTRCWARQDRNDSAAAGSLRKQPPTLVYRWRTTGRNDSPRERAGNASCRLLLLHHGNAPAAGCVLHRDEDCR
jgi:hypothetical protein